MAPAPPLTGSRSRPRRLLRMVAFYIIAGLGAAIAVFWGVLAVTNGKNQREHRDIERED
jgi:hypothetical protein